MLRTALFKYALMAAAVGASISPSIPAFARETVDASAPEKLSVTIYRDPTRGEDEAMNINYPQGFAMISEERVVTLPPGESTIRFDGVAEGMVAVSAIVTGLPGGTIEKNRNADLLSPAALVDGTLGNRVTITRTNPATGVSAAESAIVRTRADGGLVLQTSAGYEAVRCAGLPEKLTFDRVPSGLSAKPVFSIDTKDKAGGTYRVVLTYLAWGFDWQANYVATLSDRKPDQRRRNSREPEKVRMQLTSWLTLLNDNGQSFPDAELLAVAGTINVVSDFEGLAEPPIGEPLRLRCYPIGSTAAGSPVPFYGDIPVPPPPVMMAMAPDGYSGEIVVTASRRESAMDMAAPIAVIAAEEQLGDLKLYRIPEPVTVSAKGQKRVAFLQRDDVTAQMLYVGYCETNNSLFTYVDDDDEPEDWDAVPAQIFLATVNDEENGLGVALPQGGLTLFEPVPAGTMLIAEQSLRDYASGQDIELELSESHQVFTECGHIGDAAPDDNGGKWARMLARASNANPFPVRMRFILGRAFDWDVRGLSGTRIKDGERIWEVIVPANSTREFKWRLRSTDEG